MFRFFLSTILLTTISVAFGYRYEITGTVADSTYFGKELTLTDVTIPKKDNLFVVIDSCQCDQHGNFVFSGEYDKDDIAVIGARYEIPGGVRTDYIGTLIMADGHTEMDMAAKAPVPRTRADEHLRKLIVDSKKLAEKVRDKQMDMTTYRNSVSEICKKTIDTDSDNPAGQYALYFLSNFIDKNDWFAMFMAAPDYLQQYAPSIDLAETIAVAMQTEKGKKFIDVKGIGLDGQPLSLSDIAGKGKITIVDFWASWCRPCLDEISSTLKPLYLKYGSDGRVSFVGIGVNDKTENLRSCAERFDIKWPIITDPTVFPGEIYGFNSIPFIVVIGADGKIVARGVRGNQLVSLIDDLLKSQN